MKFLTLLANVSARTRDSASIGVKWSMIGLLLERYVFQDWEFAGFLIVVVIVDTISGILRAGVERRLSSKGLGGVFIKVAVYAMMLVLGHVLTGYKVHGKPNLFFQWGAGFLDAVMIAREALSILENCAALIPGLVPASLLRRLAQFQSDPPPFPPTV